jgi:ribosome-associated protein
MNRAEARARLADLVRKAAARPKSRRKTRPTQAARKRRLAAKLQRSEIKAARGRVRGED